MMYEELIKRLRNAAMWSDKGMVIVPSLTLEAADAIEELCKEVDALKHDIERYIQINTDLLNESKWISAEERLPDARKTVLCFLKSLDGRSVCYSTDYLLEDGQWWRAGSSWRFAVTHWMPLPEPPKEET